jgi:hypothetical protein
MTKKKYEVSQMCVNISQGVEASKDSQLHLAGTLILHLLNACCKKVSSSGHECRILRVKVPEWKLDQTHLA